jgi:Zn-finger nucleic acid-binding protein
MRRSDSRAIHGGHEQDSKLMSKVHKDQRQDHKHKRHKVHRATEKQRRETTRYPAEKRTHRPMTRLFTAYPRHRCSHSRNLN